MLLAFKAKGVRRKSNLHKKKLSIAIPASVVSDVPHPREKTSKIGLIGRAAAVFRVDEVIIYPDNPKINQMADMDLIATLLTYMETPQYLRRRLFKLIPELRYAGILPPLRTPHHPINRKMKNLKVGEYREGVTLFKAKDGTFTDIGVEQPALLLNKQPPISKRITVKITKTGERVEVELAKPGEIPEYWGYIVTVEKRLFGKIVKNRSFDLIIATSKHGLQLTDIIGEMTEEWKKANTILVAFGAPTQGLYEIVECERLSLDDVVDFVINTIPIQGTETVRTEEALIASLAILNQYFRF